MNASILMHVTTAARQYQLAMPVKAAHTHAHTNAQAHTFNTGLLPMYTAPITCSAGISSGKLKGVMTATGPKANLTHAVTSHVNCLQW